METKLHHNNEFEDQRLRFTDSGTNPNPTSSSSSSSPIQSLNDELLLEILLRVHFIKFIFRCKCVCKLWSHLIHPHPYFLRRIDQPPTFFLLSVFSDHPLQITPLRTNRVDWFRRRSIDGFSLSFLPIPDPTQIHVLNSSNGLILCSPGHDRGVFFVCNPVTELWLSLPNRSISPERRGVVLAALIFEEKGARFRVVCVPARCESPEFAVEVFSSETGRWDKSPVRRGASGGFPEASTLSEVIACNGVVFWQDHDTFVTFDPWDCAFRLCPLPHNARAYGDIVLCGQTRGCLRIMIRHILVQAVGPTYTIYTLKDYESGEWFMERVVELRRLVARSGWLSKYALRRASHGSGCLAFHPENADLVYLRCKDYVVQVNTGSGEWRLIDVVHRESKVYHHRAVPLMLPWWPTPLPVLPRTRTAQQQIKHDQQNSSSDHRRNFGKCHIDLLFASPAPTFYKIVKNKSVEEFKPDPYLATIMNCLLGVFYGLPMIRPNSLLVVTINGAGLAIEAIYCTMFFIYADKKGRMKLVIWILAEVAAMAVVVPCTLLLLHTHAKRTAVVGILMVIFLVLMYISPLTVMGKVIKTKSVKYMPFYLSLANFLNGVIWVTFALIEFDLYILIGNSLGALSGAAQLILYACYYKSTPKYDDVLPSSVQLASRD